ncbi:Glycosyl transferase, family 8 [uncultured Caudovirales phage]|uniref:Glycosyl transferase, family 8 n=1 Tax=uncultured Caudovirales phage TaxID=2100421 RepID=A0A6J5PJ73_9CAUD|nr:Glycosyl transferase, family 8 [uncultured Caudovirales phage]
MIAVTIATPDYANLANEQAFHFRKNSGLKTTVMLIGDGQDGYAAKLDLPNVFRSTRVVFFDADYRLLRPVSFDEFDDSEAIYGVHDGAAYDIHAFPNPDCKNLGIPKPKYINTGFFIINFNNWRHRKAFSIASQLLEDRKNGTLKIDDVTEQSMLNAGIIRSGSKLIHMHPRWNFYPYSFHHGSIPEVPSNVIGVHAAGISGVQNKADHLNAYSLVFGGESYPKIKEATRAYSKWRGK